MAAAYGALVSVMQIIEQLQHHPRPPISLDKEQTQSLTEKVVFLQDFLEAYNFHGVTKEAEDLMSRIADAAYAAEDVIESHVVDRILARSTSTLDEEKISSVDFYQGLQKVIKDLDLVKKEVMEIKDEMGIQHQQPKVITTPAASSESHSTEQNKTMVGFDDVFKEVMDKLTGQPSQRQIIPISGMGGIGKTTLAKNVYTNPSMKRHFDVLAWVTVSQQYNIRETLLEVLLCQIDPESKGSLSQMSEKQLREMLYKSLWGRPYLIVMDDMWNIKAWDDIKFCFPDNNSGSRILVTTRIPEVVLHLAGSYNLKMNFLDKAKSWKLFCENVFGQEDCLAELEEVGKKIVYRCQGLPLSIVSIGGLAKSKQTLEYWEFVAENLNSIVNLNENERCLKILHTSYNQLPIHLKPCFLYMGIFPEDSDIQISELIKQWVAEGFVKPSSAKSLEETAKECFMDLVERNLILVKIDIFTPKRDTCNIHDLLRDLCVREAQKEKFFYVVTSPHSPDIITQGIRTKRRIAIYGGKSQEEYRPQLLHALESAPLARSLTCHFEGDDLPSLDFRLLRVLKTIGTEGRSYPLPDIFQLVNSRYLDMSAYWDPIYGISSSLHMLWNLQTFIIKGNSEQAFAPSEFWMMPLLRHVEFQIGIYLPDPPSTGQMEQDDFVLENLQTLLKIRNFNCSEDVLKRIPNLKELGIVYEDYEEGFEVASHYCLNNIDRLHKLETLYCFFDCDKEPSRSDFLRFPNSLKELNLQYSRLNWEDMNSKIGSLPLLQVLKVSRFKGPKWETVEGKFPSLRKLEISLCDDLEYWTTESTHFPRLENLHLMFLERLKEIPSDIGEIPTLESIELYWCSDSAVISAKTILKEQEEVGNEGLRVHVSLLSEVNDISFSSDEETDNFQVSHNQCSIQ